MPSGNAIRGARVGVRTACARTERYEPAPRSAVTYWCRNDHVVDIRIAADVEPPALWDCPRCGLPAGQDARTRRAGPAPSRTRRHLAYVKERRTAEEGEALLAEALAALRRRRGRSDRSAVGRSGCGDGVSAGCAVGPARRPPPPGPAASRVRPTPVHAGRRQLHRAGAGQRHPHRARLVGAGGDQPDLLGGVDRRQGERGPHRRRLGAAPHRADRPGLVADRVLGEDRRHVAVLADAEHQHVEVRQRGVPGPGRRGQLLGVRGGRRPPGRRRPGRPRPASGAPGPGPAAPRPAARRGPGSRCGPGPRPAGTARRPTRRRPGTSRRRRGPARRAPPGTRPRRSARRSARPRPRPARPGRRAASPPAGPPRPAPAGRRRRGRRHSPHSWLRLRFPTARRSLSCPGRCARGGGAETPEIAGQGRCVPALPDVRAPAGLSPRRSCQCAR